LVLLVTLKEETQPFPAKRLDIVIDLRQSLQRRGAESCQKGLVLPLVQMGTQLP
jgi:hypothetical protein